MCDGRYIFKRIIEKGSHSSVFLYEDAATSEPYAVKIDFPGVKNVMMLSESLYLREQSAKIDIDRFPKYMEHGNVEEESGFRRFLIMQFIDKSLNEYIA
jgi:hypothetical protein